MASLSCKTQHPINSAFILARWHWIDNTPGSQIGTMGEIESAVTVGLVACLDELKFDTTEVVDRSAMTLEMVKLYLERYDRSVVADLGTNVDQWKLRRRIAGRAMSAGRLLQVSLSLPIGRLTP